MLERLTRSVKELFEAVPALDPDRLHQEAMLLAMRADVREEIDRLRVHGAAVRALLDGGGADNTKTKPTPSPTTKSSSN